MKVVIAGGGTGGHLYPGIAIAEVLKDRGDDVLFVGTARGIEATAVPKAGFDLALIKVGGLKRLSVLRKLKTAWELPRSVFASMAILRKHRAEAVVGVGGYASGPVVLAARMMGIPTAVCEQNSVPGLTNRILGKMVRRVFGTFAHAAPQFPSHKFKLVGNPVRASFLASIAAHDAGGAVPHVPGRVFVVGGSQGARPLNENVPGAIAALKARGLEVSVVHQTGKAECDKTKAAYDALGLTDADVRPFIDDMVAEYRAAHVVVCRAGATTCAELGALGVPSILVPFPQAADDHQTLNARELADDGGAVLLPQHTLDADALADAIAQLTSDPAARAEMARRARAFGRPDAARIIADSIHAGFRDAVAS